MKEILENQYKNSFLWVPFIMAFGGALYFSLGTEPNFRFPIIITGLVGAIIYKYKNIFMRALFLFAFGFFYSMSFTHIINTPQINNSFDFIHIDAIVKDIDFTSVSNRVLLNVPSNQIDKNLPNQNINIRVSLKDTDIIPNPGDKIVGDLRIFHPSPKYTPNGFDFARWAYFNKISGTGFFKNYEITKSDNTNIREFIHNKSNSVLSDALILGYKHVIPDAESTIWKSVGMGHIWSISGFHMTLIGGWLFALFYLMFRAIPYITKRIPAKYPSVICAWFGLLVYLYISGIGTATLRAFLMTTFIFVATILGRGILSLRNAALAFLIIFFIKPFAVINAGFQLSFAAIFGLLWFFNDTQYIKRNTINKILHYLYLSFASATIATLFTLPFIIAHFGYIPIYSLIGNIILLPVFSFAIMPLIMIGTCLALFGNHFILDMATNIYNFALSVAQYISNLPHANIYVPDFSNTVFTLIIIGLVSLILIVKPQKQLIKNINCFICMVFISLAMIIYIFEEKPLFYATSDHELVAFNINNKLEFNKSRDSKHYFAFSAWYKMNNEIKPDKNTKYKCKKGLCVYKTDKWNLVYMQNFTAILDNIENMCNDKDTDYIIATYKINSENCQKKILNHGLLIYPNGKVRTIINRRPWHNQHE